MSIWEFREFIEHSIPVWIPMALTVVIMAGFLIQGFKK
jgi:hypothetical protein